MDRESIVTNEMTSKESAPVCSMGGVMSGRFESADLEPTRNNEKDRIYNPK